MMETVKQPKIHYAWWILVVCFLMNMTTHALNFQTGGLFTKPISEALNIPRSVFALQTVAASLGAVVSAPIWGKLYRQYDMRKLLAFCTLMTATCVFLRPMMPGAIPMALLGFVRGVFLTGNTVLPNTILLTAWFGKSRGFAVSTASLGISAGSAIFNPLLQSIITNMGWQTADRVSALIIAVVMIPLVLLIVRATPKEKGLQPLGLNKQMGAGQPQGGKQGESTGLTLKQARSTPAFYVLLFITFSVTFVTGAALQLSAYLTDIGYTPAAAATAIAVNSVVSLVGKVLLGFSFDKLKLKTSSALVFVTGIVTFLCFTFARNIVALGVALVLWGFASGVTSIMTPLWTSTIFGTKDYGSIYGWVLSVNRFGGIVGTYLVSLLFDLTGSNDLIWPICVVVMLLSMIGIFYCLNASRKWRQAEGEPAPSAAQA